MTNQSKTKKVAGLQVVRKERESTGGLLRRFTQRVKQSEVLLEARKNKFRRPIPNKIARRKSALVRASDREKYRELRKWGKVK